MSKLFPTFGKILKMRFSFKKILKKLVIIMIVLAALIIVKDEIAYQFGDYADDYYSDDYYEDEFGGDGYCMEGENVAGITIKSDLYTYVDEPIEEDSESYTATASENIVYYINEAENDSNFKAIILEIDSWGGEATAAKEVADALKRAKKPTIALIREFGLSAAYWAATGADIIFANTTSNVGSIGVTMSYLDYSQQNERDGITYQQISSGKFKDTGDPDKRLNWEEKQLLQRDTDLLNEIFISEVALNRGMEISEVEKLADGSSMLGQMALDKGLIDKLGGEHEALEYLEEILGGDVGICW